MKITRLFDNATLNNVLRRTRTRRSRVTNIYAKIRSECITLGDFTGPKFFLNITALLYVKKKDFLMLKRLPFTWFLSKVRKCDFYIIINKFSSYFTG